MASMTSFPGTKIQFGEMGAVTIAPPVFEATPARIDKSNTAALLAHITHKLESWVCEHLEEGSRTAEPSEFPANFADAWETRAAKAAINPYDAACTNSDTFARTTAEMAQSAGDEGAQIPTEASFRAAPDKVFDTLLGKSGIGK